MISLWFPFHKVFKRRRLLKTLFGSVNNIVLQRAGQGCEQRAITSYANHQRLVLFGVLLRVKQGFASDNVELHVHTLLVEIGTDKGYEFGKPTHTRQRRRVEFLV